jgi:hypothetical protein
MKLLDHLLNGSDADEKENLSKNIVTCVTSVTAVPEPKSISKVERPDLTGPEMAQQVSRWLTAPHCPRCTSYALHEQDNMGAYECQNCGLQNIEEQVARRVM